MDGTPPSRQKPRDLDGYLEAISRSVFQAGISWRVIDSKWAHIRRAFAAFAPETDARRRQPTRRRRRGGVSAARERSAS
jgi:3-methyladenine DNA glycosylase Tag